MKIFPRKLVEWLIMLPSCTTIAIRPQLDGICALGSLIGLIFYKFSLKHIFHDVIIGSSLTITLLLIANLTQHCFVFHSIHGMADMLVATDFVLE